MTSPTGDMTSRTIRRPRLRDEVAGWVRPGPTSPTIVQGRLPRRSGERALMAIDVIRLWRRKKSSSLGPALLRWQHSHAGPSPSCDSFRSCSRRKRSMPLGRSGQFCPGSTSQRSTEVLEHDGKHDVRGAHLGSDADRLVKASLLSRHYKDFPYSRRSLAG